MLLEISQEMNIVMSVGTLIGLIIFTWHTSSKITSFKEETEFAIKENKEAFEKHLQQHIKDNIAERLARIETDIQWIRTALETKAKKKG